MWRVLGLFFLFWMPLESLAKKTKTVDCDELTEIESQDSSTNTYTLNDKPFTGKCESYYPNGQKSWEGNFKDGKPHGTSNWWYESGQKSSKWSFKDGKEHGTYTTWYNNGQKEWEGNWKDGDH